MKNAIRHLGNVTSKFIKPKGYILSLLIVLIFGALYMRHTWISYSERSAEQALELAKAAEAFLRGDLMSSLGMKPSDMGKSPHDKIKESLANLTHLNYGVDFSYIYTQRDGKLHVIANSASRDLFSSRLLDAEHIYMKPFEEGRSVVSRPMADGLGNGISVLMPVKDLETKEVIAVLGLEYPAKKWYGEVLKHTMHAGIIAISLFFIVLAFYKVLNKNAELRESERSKAVLLSNLPGMAYRCSVDRDWTMQFVSDGCFELTGYRAESLLYNKEISFNELIKLEYRDTLWVLWDQVIASRSVFKYEYPIVTASGDIKWVYEQGQGIYTDKGEVEALEGLIIDITDRKVREDEIDYLKDHDSLTGLYNRRYFEQEKERLDHESQWPLSVIIADVNGIKLINDAFGHVAGDILLTGTAKILQQCCREGDVIARIGGDEYGILLPNTDYDSVLEVVNKIKTACRDYNDMTPHDAYSINLSLGYSTKKTAAERIDQVMKSAEDHMYKSKLLEQKSSYSAIVSSINATVYEKSQETEEHAKRLAALSKEIGIELNLSHAELDDLELLATLHDIGKVGIDDRILNKPGKLNDEEWEKMKKHPEIGYRIAMASPELSHVAEYILCHHERWDGRGYPQGIEGEEIPLLSRILSVVDAYDAMTEDRIYREALSEQAAIEELKRNAGTQFDPNIVKIFVEQVIDDKST